MEKSNIYIHPNAQTGQKSNKDYSKKPVTSEAYLKMQDAPKETLLPKPANYYSQKKPLTSAPYLKIQEKTQTVAPETNQKQVADFEAMDKNFAEVRAHLAKREAERKAEAVAEEKFIALDAELEKKRNDEYEARKKKRDDEYEKNWGKK